MLQWQLQSHEFLASIETSTATLPETHNEPLPSTCWPERGKSGKKQELVLQPLHNARQLLPATDFAWQFLLYSSLPFARTLSLCSSDFWSSHLYYVAWSFIHKLMQLKYNTHTQTHMRRHTLTHIHTKWRHSQSEKYCSVISLAVIK